MFVIHELAEDVELLTQELVGEIHLMGAGRKRRDVRVNVEPR